jgi:DNA-binding winged helix-turn-helix (wHTH) protein
MTGLVLPCEPRLTPGGRRSISDPSCINPGNHGLNQSALGYCVAVIESKFRLPERARSLPGGRSFAFDAFLLVEATRSLLENGRRVDLPPRYFDLLVFLIERRERVVTKDDLYDGIWKDEIVTEGAIAQGVRFLRRSLRDDARNPRFIRTVAKFGYQWIGPLADASAEAEPGPAPIALPASTPSREDDRPVREISLRAEMRTAFRIALERYASASAGSALTGGLAGGLGALLLVVSSSVGNPGRVIGVLALLGLIIGGLGGLGVGFGLSFAEALVRRSRALVLCAAGGLSGALVGGLGHAAFAATVGALFGRAPLRFGGAHEGVWIGAFVGLGYGLSTRDLVLAAPRAAYRLRVVGTAAIFCALGAALGSGFGASFTASSVDAIASLFRGSELSLAALGSWTGEPGFGRLSRIALSAYEGLFFGAGLVYGLTRRPSPGG